MEATNAQAATETLPQRQISHTVDPRYLPFWRTKAGLTIFGIFATLAPTITTGVAGHFAKNREIAIEDRKQSNEMRRAYLTMALDQQRPLADRQEILRFLATVMDGDPIQRWANDELVRVGGELNKLTADLEDEKRKAIAAFHEEEQLRRQIAEKRRSSTEAAQIEELQAKITKYQAERRAAIETGMKIRDRTASNRVAKQRLNCAEGDPLCGSGL
jgi:hypothetical protein